MLLKALVTLEGTARLISPKFSLVEMIQPYRRKLVWRRFSPRRRLRKLHRLFWELDHLLDILPRGIADVLDQMQSGRFDIHLDHRGLEPSVNRLVLGMLASALFVGSALLLSLEVPPLVDVGPLKEISMLGAVAAVVSIALGSASGGRSTSRATSTESGGTNVAGLASQLLHRPDERAGSMPPSPAAESASASVAVAAMRAQAPAGRWSRPAILSRSPGRPPKSTFWLGAIIPCVKTSVVCGPINFYPLCVVYSAKI